MGEAVVILTPDRRGDQQVQRRDLFPPRQVIADRQPFRVLIEHGVDHVNKGFIRREEAVPAGQQVAFEHAFHGVLAEHLDDPAVGRQFAAIRVFREVFGDPELLADFIDVLQLVRRVFVRAEDAKAIHVRFHDVAKEGPERTRILRFDLPGLVDFQAIFPEVRQAQRLLRVVRRLRGDWRSSGGCPSARAP